MANEEDGDDTVCLGESFFINRDYELTTFTFGPHVLSLYCLQSASIDYDLTGQLVWPGAVLLSNYLSKNTGLLKGRSVIELGSGVGVTGILCSRFCREVILTDHNEEVLQILKKNIELQSSSGFPNTAGLAVEKLEWGNSDELNSVLEKHPKGFDLIIGADICFQQSSIPPLFNTVGKLLHFGGGQGRFILAYISRAKIEFANSFKSKKIARMDAMVIDEAAQHGMQVNEVHETRSTISNLEGVIYEITLI